MRSLTIIGGGPAGAAAALSAAESSHVVVYEKSHFPRHKVCGEFLSPEILPLIDRVGLAGQLLALSPSRIARVRLHLGTSTKRWSLQEPALGLSRYAFDQLLLGAAIERGVEVRRESAGSSQPGPLVVAHGRRNAAGKGNRLFGFKAHFTGACDDGVDLVFFDRVYAGVSAVENGEINVCGLAPETSLRACGFSPDDLLSESPVLRDLLGPLRRSFDWLITGPLVFRDSFDGTDAPDIYPAGDALGFVDPFTGSGILSAVLTGIMAGQAAVRGEASSAYLGTCRRALRFQYRTAGLLRRVIEAGWPLKLPGLAGLLPGRALFDWTRPRIPV